MKFPLSSKLYFEIRQALLGFDIYDEMGLKYAEIHYN